MNMKKEFVERCSILVISAFGLVAALAWNETVKMFFATYYETPNTPWSMLIYASIVTVIAVLITLQLSKVGNKKK